MNITEMLGLQDERMASVVKDHWAGWVAFEPRLGVVDDPCRLDAWGRAADPAVANVVWEAALMVADWFHSLGNVEKNS